MEKKTNFQFSTSVNEGILEVVMTGKLATADVEGLQIKLTDIIIETGAKALLIDSREVDGRGISLPEIFDAARRQIADIPKATTAVVDWPEHVDKLSFLETTAFNAGWSVKWFADLDDARAWLKNKLSKESGKYSVVD